MVQQDWRYGMNDSEYIYGMKRYDDLLKAELEKIEAVYRECDVMVTHVNPSIDMAHVDPKFRSDPGTAFFAFDGQGYLEKTTAKYWVYGHTHEPNRYRIGSCEVVCNPMGYPGESRNGAKTRVIELQL